MNARFAMRPAWTIVQRLWLDRGWGFTAILGVAVACWLGLAISGVNYPRQPAAHVAIIMSVGLSIAPVFLLCNFTEADRRERRVGFPARLFVLPVPTRTLVSAPILFSVVLIAIIYAVWTASVARVFGRDVPLALPLLYVVTGMICYHAIVWSLARYPLFRLLALSLGGGTFFVGVLPLYDHAWLVPLLGGVSVSRLLTVLLCGISAVALAIAYFAVEAQRHGGRVGSDFRARLTEILLDALPRDRRRFASPQAAHFWLEWRRHGLLLPLCVGGVLLLAILPAPFVAPISAPVAGVLFEIMLVAPLLLAFALGQGLGKADLWSKQPGMSLFLATKPLRNTEWISVKMKTAAVAAALAWLLVIVLVPLWLWQWCDRAVLVKWWRTAEHMYGPGTLYLLPVVTLAVLLIATWRFLVASLFIGLAGRAWLLTAATCSVFVVVCGVPGLIVLWIEEPHLVRPFLKWPEWTPWVLTGLCAGKIVAAILITHFARRRGWVGTGSIVRYLVVWLATTGFLLLAAGWLLPVHGWQRWLSVMLILLFMPLARVAYAPVALAHNRHR